MKNIIFSALALILSASITMAQVTETWVSRYNGPGNNDDGATWMDLDASGNVYVTGYRTGTGGNKDYATLKYNPSGVLQWGVDYNGPGNGTDLATSIAVDGSGNVYITGYSTGSGSGYDFATIKYNSSGVQQWAQRYNGTANGSDVGYSIAVDGSGNVYVTGSSAGTGTSDDFLTIKYNSAGTVQWLVRTDWPQSGSDATYSLALDASSNVYITGTKFGSSSNLDYGTIKYNSSGVQQWATGYNGTGNGDDVALSITVDGTGNSYVTGASDGIGTDYDIVTIKYNSSGVQQWVGRYDGPVNGEDIGYSVKVDGSSNVYVTGSRTANSGTKDFATTKYNSSGVVQWNAGYNGPGSGDDIALSLALDGTGNVYVTGQSIGLGTNFDYATLKYNSSGVQQWTIRYNGPGNGFDGATCIVAGTSGNVYVTGYSTGTGTLYDIAVIRYSQPVGIETINCQTPEKFSLEQNYPNPFNPRTVISFQLPVAGNVSLKIYDIVGREVEKLVDERLEPGGYEIQWDATNYQSGIYFYEILATDYAATKKMVLVK